MDRAAGSPWRDLTEHFPNWKSVYTRGLRWLQCRLWPRILSWLASEHAVESYAIDASYVRVQAIQAA